MAERLKAKLPGIGRPLGKALRFGFDHKVVLAAAHRTGDIPSQGDLCAGKVILRGMVDIDSGHVERLRGVKVIYLGLNAVRVAAPVEIKILRDELIGSRMFADERGLPGQI